MDRAGWALDARLDWARGRPGWALDVDGMLRAWAAGSGWMALDLNLKALGVVGWLDGWWGAMARKDGARP